MSGPFDPDAYLAKVKTQPRKDAPFDPDAYLEKARQKAAPKVEPGTPLDRALAEQRGDVVTVETPTGPAQFTRSGARFYGPEEAEQIQQVGGARLKEKALEGGLSLLSGGGPLVDEFVGTGSALRSLGTDEKFGDAYRRGRDRARFDVASATRNASPDVSIMGTKIPVLPALGAAAPSMFAPLPAGWLGRMLSSIAQGTGSAASSSNADLTQGEGRRFLRDVGQGAAVSALASGGSEVLAAPVRYFGRQAGAAASEALERATAQTQAARDKALKSAQGAAGGVTAGGINSIEWLDDVLANPAKYTAAEIAEAAKWEADPVIRAVRSNALQGNFEKLDRFIPARTTAQANMAEAAARAQPAAVAAEVARKTTPGAITGDLASKAWNSIGQRAVLGALGSGAGAGVAYLAGEDPKAGAALGATAGFLPQGALQFMRNQAKSPIVQFGANALTSKLTEGAGGLLAREAQAVAPVAQSMRPQLSEEESAAIDAFLQSP